MNQLTIHIAFSLLAGAFTAFIAKKRGKDPIRWFAIGAALGLFGILPIFFLPGNSKRRAPETTAPQQKIYFLEGPIDKFWYYLDREMQQQGPMSFSALSAAWRSGKVDGSMLVWNEELPDWKPLQDFVRSTSSP